MTKQTEPCSLEAVEQAQVEFDRRLSDLIAGLGDQEAAQGVRSAAACYAAAMWNHGLESGITIGRLMSAEYADQAERRATDERIRCALEGIPATRAH